MLEATSTRPGHSRARALLAALAALLLGAATVHAQDASSLAVARAGERYTWWDSERAPERWSAPDSAVARALRWTPLRPGLRLGELDLLVNGGLLRLRVIVAEVALAGYDLELVRRTERGRAAWSVDVAPAGAALAVNAGQFTEASPWGWLVLAGRVAQAPGQGPLSAAVAADSAGLAWIDAAALPATWDDPRWRLAFQSYPVLLRHGRVPAALRRDTGVLDLRHRDARLALGLRGDTLLLVLTRYAGAGAWLERFPAGLTTPEMAALLGALGARDALMLDGGLSAQLLVRDRTGRTRAWPGSRAVPLGLVLREKAR